MVNCLNYWKMAGWVPLFFCLLLSSCSRTPLLGIGGIVFKARENGAILSTDLSAHPDGDLIWVRAPYGMVPGLLKPEISYFGGKINPPDGIVQDFSQPVVYTVEDGPLQRKYTIEIKPDPEPFMFPVAGNGVAGLLLFDRLVIPNGGGVIRLTAPPGYENSSKKYPLHLHFHGAGGDPVGSELKFPFEQSAGTPGFGYFFGSWQSGKVNMLAMLDYLVKTYPIDTEHIWLSGHSTGVWNVFEGGRALPPDTYTIELSMLFNTQYVSGCPSGKNHIIISGSYDFVPLFGYLSNLSLYYHYREELRCGRETVHDLYFEGYPHMVTKYSSTACKDDKEVHLYTLRGAMHNPQLSRNFINNLMREAFRMGKTRE